MGGIFKGSVKGSAGRERQDTSLETQEASLLQNIAKDDRARSALRLSRILLHHQFRHISVLEGGESPVPLSLITTSTTITIIMIITNLTPIALSCTCACI